MSVPPASLNTRTHTRTHGTTCPRCKTAHKERLCRATTHGIPLLVSAAILPQRQPSEIQSDLETPAVVNDKKENAIMTHPGHHRHKKTAATFGKLHLPPSLLAQLCYQSSLLTILGLFCRCARLLLCHCCVFFHLGFQ